MEHLDFSQIIPLSFIDGFPIKPPSNWGNLGYAAALALGGMAETVAASKETARALAVEK